MKEKIVKQAELAKQASRKLALLDTETKNRALSEIAAALESRVKEIVDANQKDIEKAKSDGLSAALIDRLTLNDKRVSAMAQGVLEIISLSDPVGETINEWTRPNGIRICKVRVPLGVIGMIYESRPNVTIDATALCLKSGNAVILRGGSEAFNSNLVLAGIVSGTLNKAGLPGDAVQFINTTDRQAIFELIKLDKYIDVIIPRGGEQLIRTILENSTVPVISHGKGNCHVYVDKSADTEKAIKICFNAKVQRPGVCNAMEKLLVHQDIAGKFLPLMVEEYKKAGVEIRGCENTRQIIKNVLPSTNEDWNTEYLGLVLAIKVVDSIEDAIIHINTYGSGHTESIITEDNKIAGKFLAEVDASCVMHNASTRLHDGSVFGLGAEIGISTQKLHARGTMGARELTSTKYLVFGTGQIRE